MNEVQGYSKNYLLWTPTRNIIDPVIVTINQQFTGETTIWTNSSNELMARIVSIRLEIDTSSETGNRKWALKLQDASNNTYGYQLIDYQQTPMSMVTLGLMPGIPNMRVSADIQLVVDALPSEFIVLPGGNVKLWDTLGMATNDSVAGYMLIDMYFISEVA